MRKCLVHLWLWFLSSPSHIETGRDEMRNYLSEIPRTGLGLRLQACKYYYICVSLKVTSCYLLYGNLISAKPCLDKGIGKSRVPSPETKIIGTETHVENSSAQ